MFSPIGQNITFCCSRFGASIVDLIKLTHADIRDGFEASMFEAKAKAGLVVLEAKAKILQGQGQWSLRPTKKDMFKAQVFYFH